MLNPLSKIWVLFIILFSHAGTLLALEPFFDHNPQTRYAPPPPRLSDFDHDILRLCGSWGSEVKARDFEKLMLQKKYRPILQRIQKALGGRIYTRTNDDSQFVRELRRVWFEQKGFQHVFCGEIEHGKLGGLHYAPRYWQAQKQSWAGYRKLKKNYRNRPVAACRRFYIKEQIKPPVFTTSIAFYPPGKAKKSVKCLGGYHYLMDAETILIAGTQAFKQANRRAGKNTKESCLFPTRVKDIPPHYSTFVIKQRALRTFYPMAEKKPYCKKNRKNLSACLCSNLNR